MKLPITRENFYLFVAFVVSVFIIWGMNADAAEYTFTFNVPEGNKVSTLKYKIEADNQWDALRKAGVFCGTFFGIGEKELTRDQEDDIIDACANPSMN